MNRFASILPGRLRIRAPELRGIGIQQALQALLRELPATVALRANAAARSLLVVYDPQVMPPQAMQQQVADILDRVLGHPAQQTPTPPRKGAPVPAVGLAGSRQMQLNRAAKIGMLSSLSASLALAAAGAKHWHIGTGMAFVACLGAHLVTHRRRLLR